MPNTDYLNILIEGQQTDLDPTVAESIAVNYKLEDSENFQKKTSSESFNIKLPATTVNDKIFNSFHNPSIADATPNESFKSFRQVAIVANGYEMLTGKASLTNATKQNGIPQGYQIDCYGNNGDWMIALKDTTLYDAIKFLTFTFDNATIEASWAYNGQAQSLPYVFAPVKYAGWMDDQVIVTDINGIQTVGADNNYLTTTMKPSLSVYWMLYFGFKLIGYKIKSDFLNSEYFRRLTMPWTWGSFLSSEGTAYELHKFLSKSVADVQRFGASGSSINEYWDLNVSNDSTLGAFDNNDSLQNPTGTIPGGDYSYDVLAKEMKWKYNTPDYGTLEAHMAMSISWQTKVDGHNSDTGLAVDWFKNGVFERRDTVFAISGGTLNTAQDASLTDLFFYSNVVSGDVISAKVWLRIYKQKGVNLAVWVKANIIEFKLDYFRIPIGGKIMFDKYLSFQKHKFLDFLTGIIDCFDLSIQTDSPNKEIFIEPTHPYSLSNDLSKQRGGYINGNQLAWNEKQDQSKLSTLELYSDYSRELILRFKDDGQDGIYKLIKDRNVNLPGAGKYYFPDRFSQDPKEKPNRFFSVCMHYNVTEMSFVTGDSPQMIVMQPENISNTSHSQAENTFEPKIAYYKGLVTGAGGWVWNGVNQTQYPFMFSVNYKPGGESDPVISYCDENINGVLAKGLLKRFFWQRFAIMRNGQWLTDHFNLKNIDVSNYYHREFIVIDGNKWELTEIKSFKPLGNESTECSLRKWVPVSETELKNTFPSEPSILFNQVSGLVNGVVDITTIDMKYCKLVCLGSDIPKPN